MICPNGEPVVLEVNTLPGMTATSLLPKAAAAAIAKQLLDGSPEYGYQKIVAALRNPASSLGDIYTAINQSSWCKGCQGGNDEEYLGQ